MKYYTSVKNECTSATLNKIDEFWQHGVKANPKAFM